MSNLSGQVIAHYRLDGLLGDGGMGAVYEAYDLKLERQVAIKLMHAHFASQPEFQARLSQEAKAAAQLDHPSIVRILEFGESEKGLYIAMEYVGRSNLRAYLKRVQSRPAFIPLSQSLQIGFQIADALDYAHRRGVIHRDVKPGNIILKRLTRPDEPGEQPFRAVLTDFGLVKLLEGVDITKSGTTMGTPTYMSPEQCEGQSLDGRSDLYSLGVVLYELFTNRLPFQFRSLSEAMATHMRGEMPTPSRQIRPELPQVIESLLARSLAKSREARFADGREMAGSLRSALFAVSDQPTQVLAYNHEESTPAGAKEEFLEGYKLRIETPGYEPSHANLARESISIGRSGENDIVLPAEGVSRLHARLRITERGWGVVDLGGVNGSWLDGHRLRANELTPFVPGNVLQVGPYRLVLEGPPDTNLEARPEPDTVPVSELPTTVEMLGQAGRPVADEQAPLALFLARDEVTVEPGRPAEFKVEVVNRAQVDDRVNVRVSGVPAQWVTVPDSFIPVAAGESETVVVVIQPPRRVETPSGRQRLRIELISQQHAGLRPAVPASLTIGGFAGFEATLEPRNLRIPGTARITLRNSGNMPGEFSIVGRDPEGRVQFHGERGRIALQAGQTATVDLQLEPRSQSWFGSAEQYGFEVEVVSRSGGRQLLTGSAQSSPILPASIGYAAFFVFVFLCVLSALFLVYSRSRTAPRATAVPTVNAAITASATALSATETAIAATTTAAAATQAAATAAVLGDVDKDGLSDSQEALVGTDVNNPDTDGDGLLDGEEVLTWGTNPRNRDTDSDILPDADEVLIHKTDPTKGDTDGDGTADGVEVALRTDPLNPLDPPPTATAATPSLTPSPGAPTFTPTPSLTPTASPTNQPTASATATPTATATGTATATASATATATATSTPTATATPTATMTPVPSLVCVILPPTIDGNMQLNEWGNNPLIEFVPDGDLARRVQTYFVRDDDHFYLAFIIYDASVDVGTDMLTFYLDVNNSGGDPDLLDRFFQIVRDGTTTIQAGIGNSSDGQTWNESYTSTNWSAVVSDHADENRWIIEMEIDVSAETPLLVGGDTFAAMLHVIYSNNSQANWPPSASIPDATTWQDFSNIDCP